MNDSGLDGVAHEDVLHEVVLVVFHSSVDSLRWASRVDGDVRQALERGRWHYVVSILLLLHRYGDLTLEVLLDCLTLLRWLVIAVILQPVLPLLIADRQALLDFYRSRIE